MCPPETTNASTGNCSFAAFALLLQKHSVDVSLEMIHGDQRFFQGESQRLGEADAHQQRAYQPRPLRDRDRVHRLVLHPRFRESLAHNWENCPQVLAGRQLRNHSSIRLMSGDLRGNYIRQDLPPRTHNRRTCFITGCFNTEDGGVRHNEIRAGSSSLDDSGILPMIGLSSCIDSDF